MPVSDLRRRLAVECAEYLAVMHDTSIRSAVVRCLSDLQLGSLYELRSRLAGIPGPATAVPA